MNTPQLLTDMANLMLLLAPSASLVCLVLAGISLRRETGGVSFVIGGGFTRWMFWAVVFLALPGLLTWFTSFGVNVPSTGGGIGSSWLAGFQSDVSNFVENFIMSRMVPVLAAFMVLRSILDTAEGGHPLPSILAALFLLGTEATYALMQQYNTGTQYATADVLASLSLPHLPTRQEILAQATAMYASTPSLEDIADRAHALILDAVGARLCPVPVAAR